MANQVVVPFVASATRAMARTWVLSRLSVAKGVARAVIETMSYLGEARVRPPLPPALPA